ncbi:hypothetical protein LV779_22915 [Streptomyces thinghirensis]|nr:hypothetical protein [Streptomyces thinghirensis]
MGQAIERLKQASVQPTHLVRRKPGPLGRGWRFEVVDRLWQVGVLVDEGLSTVHPRSIPSVKVLSGREVQDRDHRYYKVHRSYPLPWGRLAALRRITREAAESRSPAGKRRRLHGGPHGKPPILGEGISAARVRTPEPQGNGYHLDVPGSSHWNNMGRTPAFAVSLDGTVFFNTSHPNGEHDFYVLYEDHLARLVVEAIEGSV